MKDLILNDLLNFKTYVKESTVDGEKVGVYWISQNIRLWHLKEFEEIFDMFVEHIQVNNDVYTMKFLEEVYYEKKLKANILGNYFLFAFDYWYAHYSQLKNIIRLKSGIDSKSIKSGYSREYSGCSLIVKFDSDIEVHENGIFKKDVQYEGYLGRCPLSEGWGDDSYFSTHNRHDLDFNIPCNIHSTNNRMTYDFSIPLRFIQNS